MYKAKSKALLLLNGSARTEMDHGIEQTMKKGAL